MSKAHRLAWSAHPAKHERPAFKRNRLGFFASCDREAVHDSGYWLRWRRNRRQVGCGRDGGEVYGLDYSSARVALATKTNREWIKRGRVEIREGSVSQLPFAADSFDLIVAVETHFWWPDLPGDLKELLRVLKPGSKLAIIAEVYKGAQTKTARAVEKYLPMTGMKLLSPDEHRNLLTDVGYTNVELTVKSCKGWIFAGGKKSY